MTKSVVAPLWDAYRDEADVVILAIDVWADDAIGESDADLVRLQREGHGFGTPPEPWRHARDTDDVLQKYGTFSIPQIAVVDPDGRLVFNHVGVPGYDDVNATVLAARSGDASTVGYVQVGILGLALLAGFASFLAPCSVGLIPAYMGFLIQGQDAQRAAANVGGGMRPAGASAAASVGASAAASVGASAAASPGTSRSASRRQTSALSTALGGGVRTALGIVTIYAVIAVALYLAGAAVRDNLLYLTPVVAVLLVAFGVMLLTGFDWDRVARGLGMGKVDGRRGFFAFGVGYGLAAFGCTGPIFLPILLAGFAQGALLGFAAFLVYTLAIAGFVVFAAYLVAAGQQTRLRALLSKTVAVTRVSAVLLIGAGLWILWFEATTYGWI
jgi:cytochrome c biogenesis protein CcdA